ncbi:MAG: hypothetical protein BAJATHORv1_30228 [Candidatus Thorarchaeota archaeon]|nr:MAG: hypothetical protein BAJATHORv1_30228 [Candidatus Thorarchaeota archaeon]
MKLPRVTFETSEKLSIGILPLVETNVSGSLPDFQEFEASIFNEIRLKFNDLDSLSNYSPFRSYRDLYWRHGMDPTKIRVSSEALVRRILKRENLWRISNIVDTANLASAYHSLPIGLIDSAYLKGNLSVRTAERGEVFERIGGKSIICRGREIVLADADKIVCFGFASYDSQKTRVRENSRDILLLIYGAPVVSETSMNDAMEKTKMIIEQWVECEFGRLAFYFNE